MPVQAQRAAGFTVPTHLQPLPWKGVGGSTLPWLHYPQERSCTHHTGGGQSVVLVSVLSHMAARNRKNASLNGWPARPAVGAALRKAA